MFELKQIVIKTSSDKHNTNNNNKNNNKNTNNDTGVCKINARSKTIRHESQPPFPQSAMLTKCKFEWIGVQNNRPIM